MNGNFRTRVFVPIVLPLTLLGVLLLFSGSLSRIMLAVDATTSIVVAVFAAAFVMVMGFLIERNDDITTRALTIAIVLGLLGVVGGGAIAMQEGIREIHHEEEHAE